MSYASLIKTLPGSLRSSTSLAAIASLGIHGLLLVVLPVLPHDSKAVESQTERSVGLIELSSAEQSRLPQAPLTTQPNVPALPQPPGETPLYNYPPVATQPSAFPPLPPPPALSPLPPGVPPLYNYPLRASLPQPQIIQVPLTAPYQNNRSFTSQLPFGKPSAPVPPSQIYRPQQLPPPPPFTVSAKPNLPSTTGLKPASPFSPPATSPSPIAQQNTNSQNTNRPQNQNLGIANQQTQISATSALPEKPPARGREDLLALLREQSIRNSTGSSSQIKPSATSARPEKLPERGREMIVARRQELLRERFERNSPGSISAAAAQRNAQLEAYEARQNRVQENDPKVETKPPIYTTLKMCQRQLDGGVAVVGVVVNPEGKIVSELEFLQQQGGAGIEQAAKDYVKRYQFPKTNKSTNQHFRLQFKYDTGNCPEPTQKQSAKNTNTNQSQS